VASYDSLHILDVSDPSNPVEVGSFDAGRGARMLQVYIAGSYAYVATYYGLRILDVSDPSNPVKTGSFARLEASGVYVSGSYVYVASMSYGILILELGKAEIAVDITSLDFGEQFIDSTSSRSFFISNTGTTELIVSDISIGDSSVFSVSPTSATIDSENNQKVIVKFTPRSEKTYTDTILISNKDSTVSISVTGTGIPVPVFNSSIGNETFKETTGIYDIWVILNDVMIDPVVDMIISEDGGQTFKDTILCALEEGKYTSAVPARSLGTVLNYYFEATDALSGVHRLPADAPSETYILRVSLQKIGDVDDDWKVDIFDLLELLKQLGGSADQTSQGDVNEDGKVDIFDLIELLKLFSNS